MITAARLRAYNPNRGQKIRTYTSGRGNKYEAGNGVVPSTWRIVNNSVEIAELSEEPQFQIMQFQDMDDFDIYIQDEMENEARMGRPPIRAAVREEESVTPLNRESDESRSAKNQQAAAKLAAAEMLRPTPLGKPAIDQVVDEVSIPKPIKEVKRMPAKKTGRRAAKKK